MRLASEVVAVVCLAAVAATSAAAGASGSPAEADLRFTRLSVEDGLSHSHVWSILQDRQGFMWFGTERGGLNRFDGYEFKVYRHDGGDPRTIAYDDVWVLYEDREGTLWVGTNGGGLDRYDREQDAFVHYRHDAKDPRSLPQDTVKALYQDEAGVFWVGTDGGLSRFDRRAGTFLTVSRRTADTASLSDDRVFSILEEKGTARLWLGVFGGGVDVLDRTTDHVVARYRHDPDDPRSLSSNEVKHLFRDRQGRLWVSTKGGLNRFDPATGTFIRYLHDPANPGSLGEGYVSATLEDTAGRFWVVTYGGLDLLDRETGKFVHYRHDANDPASLSDDGLWTIHEERTGALWIGTTNGGVSRLAAEPDKFTTYRNTPGNAHSLSNDAVFALHVDLSGRLWVGTAGGLNRLEGGGSFVRYRNDPRDPATLGHDNVRAIVEDAKGALWIGTAGGGLSRFDGKAFRRYRSDARDPASLAGDFVNALCPSREGGLWIALQGVGLDYFDGKVFRHYRADRADPRALPSYYVQAIFEDDSGMVWVATEKSGLVRLDPSSGAFVAHLLDPALPDSEAANRVHAIYPDGRHGLWLGAASGLFRFDLDKRTFTRRYTHSDGLPVDAVVSLVGDDRGDLWIGTPAGLSHLDRQRGTFRNYDQSQGLQSNQFTWRACARGPDGRLFFGGVNGFNAFDPAHLPDNPHVPAVVFTGFELFNKPVAIAERNSPLSKAIHVAEDVRLRHEQSVFTIRFAALNYTSPRNNRYAYKMEGFDADWTDTNAGRPFATYTNLDPGTYVFRVKGSNNDGRWNEEGASLRVVIVPPWWRSWWFTGLGAALIASAILAGHRVRVRTLEERERRFRTLAENAPDVVARFGHDLRCRYVNAAIELSTGRRASDCIGKTPAELGLPQEVAVPWDQGLRKVFETGEPTIQEFGFSARQGSRVFESRLVPELAADGHVTSVIAITRDITERKEAEEQVRLSLQEKVVLLQEIHHRVKNNLQVISSLLSLQAGHLADPAARGALMESKDRVRAMAMIHEKLYRSKDLTRISAPDYIQGLLAAIFRSHTVDPNRVRLETALDDVTLATDTAIPCGLLINELVVNALKHAFPDGRPGVIRVQLRQEADGELRLRVGDDGVGLPSGLDLERTTTLGLQLVNDLIRQLGGTIQRVPNEGGTSFELSFSEVTYRQRV